MGTLLLDGCGALGPSSSSVFSQAEHLQLSEQRTPICAQHGTTQNRCCERMLAWSSKAAWSFKADNVTGD
jgi:hypothetical protein